jgi:hypothetical protein
MWTRVVDVRGLQVGEITFLKSIKKLVARDEI